MMGVKQGHRLPARIKSGTLQRRDRRAAVREMIKINHLLLAPEIEFYKMLFSEDYSYDALYCYGLERYSKILKVLTPKYCVVNEFYFMNTLKPLERFK